MQIFLWMVCIIMSATKKLPQAKGKELNAIDNLFKWSDRADNFEKTVSTKDWDAVGTWTQTIPMCGYTDKTIMKNEKKKGSFKKNEIKSRNSSPSSTKHAMKKAQNTTSQNLKAANKKHDIRYFSKDKCKHYELPLLKDTLGCQTSTKNKHYFRSLNVLSYENLSWRFLFDFETSDKAFRYIKRHAPKDKVYNYLKRTKSSYDRRSEHGQKQILDPAGFIDEQILISYKNSKEFEPNQDLRQIMNKLGNNSTLIQLQQDTTIQKRLYLTSFIKKIPRLRSLRGEGESDHEVETPIEKTSKPIKQKPKRSKNQKQSKSTRKKKKDVINLKAAGTEIRGDKKLVLPPIVAKKPSKAKTEAKVIDSKEQQMKCITFKTEELYLPLLNHSNYTSKLQYLKRPEVKLPAVAGIKISLSSTSNSGLVL